MKDKEVFWDLAEHNRAAWNEEVKRGNVWTVPVDSSKIDAAREGIYQILLTPHTPVPKEWLGSVIGKKVLCLASGGGQQGSLLSAAGARVTVFDNSDGQLASDRKLAEAHGLDVQTVQGNMKDLGFFDDGVFDLIIHPVSNCFVDHVLPVWRESYRVLKPGGSLLCGFVNPLMFMVESKEVERSGILQLKHAIPYSDLKSLSPEEKEKFKRERHPFEFGHTLTDQIQGQITAGFVITGFYEDTGDDHFDPFTHIFIATRALKMV